jgi:hypothetical protein
VTLASFQTSSALQSAIIFDMRQTLKRTIDEVFKKEKKAKKGQESGMCINSNNITKSAGLFY